MIKEIFTDAIVKLEQIEVFKLEVEKHRAYKQGHLEYLVKDRYRRMLILYRHTDRLTQKNKDAQCINELVDMDNLYHDTMIFIEMMKMIEGVDNLAPIKPRFRSNTAQKEWREAADTAANDPAKLTKNPQSSETHPGKRKIDRGDISRPGLVDVLMQSDRSWQEKPRPNRRSTCRSTGILRASWLARRSPATKHGSEGGEQGSGHTTELDPNVAHSGTQAWSPTWLTFRGCESKAKTFISSAHCVAEIRCVVGIWHPDQCRLGKARTKMDARCHCTATAHFGENTDWEE
ncbi:unnamed protein product [Spodoptera exigua]|nr:unnamed protein product [Spodoptera exigua]